MSVRERESEHERERERESEHERGMGSAVIAVLVCVLLDFMNFTQACGGCLGRRGASYRSYAYSSPDHLNIVSKLNGGDCHPQSFTTSTRWQALTL